jgi:pilus assembly protein CpaE
MSDLLVASPSEQFGAKVAGAFGDQLNGHRRYWREGLFDADKSAIVAELTRNNPAVVAIGPDIAPADALELAHAFDTHRPDVVVVLVAKPSIKLLENALRSGARDVVAPDAPDADLRLAFDSALDAADRRRGVALPTEPATSSRHVICVVSPKGGAGKTTVSTNLATGLALAAPGEVVIVDLDFQFGDVGSALRMTPTHTFADIARTPGDVDITTVKVFLTPSDSGLFALCGPDAPVDADTITTNHVQHVLKLLASEFRYVVIDTGSGIDEPTLAALELSTDIVVLTSTDVPSVRATRKEIDTLDLLGLTSQKRHFVVNRADARVGLPVSEIEATVGLPAVAAIPSSRLVPISVNQGTPVVVSDRRSGVADAISRLTSRFAQTTPAPARTMPWRKNKRSGDEAE